MRDTLNSQTQRRKKLKPKTTVKFDMSLTKRIRIFQPPLNVCSKAAATGAVLAFPGQTRSIRMPLILPPAWRWLCFWVSSWLHNAGPTAQRHTMHLANASYNTNSNIATARALELMA